MIWENPELFHHFFDGIDDEYPSLIVLVAMVPTLSIAAIISRNLYKRTGNIGAPACLNAMLMTTMALANTMVAFK